MRERALAKGVLTVLDNTEVTGLEVEPHPFGRPPHPRRGDRPRRDRGGAGGDRLRRVEPAPGGHGRGQHPAHPGGAPDGGHGSDRPLEQDRQRDRLSDRARHGTCSCTSGRATRRWRWAPTPIARSWCVPTTFPPSPRRRVPPPRCRSPATTSALSSGHAREIMGELLAGSEMQYSVNGLLSLTPDTQQVLGETAEVEKLWSAAAVWIKEGPGTARLIAEWDHLWLPAAVRPARLRHHPLLCARAHRAAHPGALRRALQQDLRHRASARAVGVRTRHEPRPVP